MEYRRTCDPDTLLREHFVREVEEERRRTYPSGRYDVPRIAYSTGGGPAVPAERVIPCRRALPQELAAAALLSACAALAVSFPRGGYGIPPGTVLAERTLSIGRDVGSRMARAASEFACSRRSPVGTASWIPGRFRGKEGR